MFLNDWSNLEEMKASFWPGYGSLDQYSGELEGANILLASYDHQNYSGDAFVVFERGGKIYEVNGGHCSCYGLEDQWSPEETTIESLQHRLDTGLLGTDPWSGNSFATELQQVLDTLRSKHTAA